MDVPKRDASSAGRFPNVRLPAAAVRSLSSGVVTVAVLVIAFVALGDFVVEDGRNDVDQRVGAALRTHSSPGWDRAMRLTTELGSAWVTAPVMLTLEGWLLRRRRRRTAILVAVIWLGAQLLDVVLKQLYHRDRPADLPRLVIASGFSYPSGHTVTALVTYGLLAYLIGRAAHGWRQWIPSLFAALLVVGVAVSRVYLGVHYATDVLGSLLIAGAWLRAGALALHALDGCAGAPGHMTADPLSHAPMDGRTRHG